MPKKGELKRGTACGKRDSKLFIWEACRVCGKFRWTQTERGKAKFSRCYSCAHKLEGSTHPLWRGGRHVDKYGYIRISTGKGNRIYEHQHKMEKKLGRKLTPGENVHHINGNKHDNRIANLLLCTRKAHRKIHRQLQELLYELSSIGVIKFNRRLGNYCIVSRSLS